MFRLASLLAAPVLLVAGGAGIKAQFMGGTLAAIEAKSTARVDLTRPDTLRVQCGKSELLIDYRKINTLEYGQNVSRRYAAAILVSPVLLLSKTRRHYVTIGYTDGEGVQQAMVLRVHKGDIRMVLAALEARTGR